MSRGPYVIDGEDFDPRKSAHAFYGPHRRLSHTKLGRFLAWLRNTFPTWR